MIKRKVLIIGISSVFVSIFFFYFSSQITQFNQKSQALTKLAQAIDQEADRLGLSYSFYFKDLSFPSQELGFEESKSYPAASIIKLPILAVSFKAIAQKQMFLADQVKIQKRDIVGGSGILKAMKMPQELTLKELLKLMIAKSDNSATNKIIKLLGFDYINESFKEFGLSETSLSRKIMDFSLRRKGFENYTSSYDIAYLLNKVYRQTLVDKELSIIALDFLTSQKVKDRIPRYLPKETVVAHKTGLERGVVHDAGIVFGPKGNYIICVFVKDFSSYETAKKFIAQASLLAYNLYK